jgi:hypothetical protein
MAKASIRLPNGTSVLIEGTTDEVRQLLEFYGQAGAAPAKPKGQAGVRKTERSRKTKSEREKSQETDLPNLAEIINLIKNCDEADAIETHILDRTSQVNRILLPLYILHEHMDNRFALSSGDIKKITTDLGIPIQTPNASHTLSDTASRYVMGDKVRMRGRATRYKLSRRGLHYFKSVLKGSPDDKQK